MQQLLLKLKERFNMSNFYLTFGQKYAEEPHPKFALAHPNGYVRIQAENYEQAREFAFREFGPYWAFLYDEEDFAENLDMQTSHYPGGRIGDFKAGPALAPHPSLSESASPSLPAC